MAERMTRGSNPTHGPKPRRELPVLTDPVPLWRDALGRIRIAGRRLADVFVLRRLDDALFGAALGLVVTLSARYLLGEPQTWIDWLWFTVAIVVPSGVLLVVSERRRRRRGSLNTRVGSSKAVGGGR